MTPRDDSLVAALNDDLVSDLSQSSLTNGGVEEEEDGPGS
jgi:hypothetical protein